MTQPTAKVMKEKLLEDFNGVVTDAEQLLKSMTNDDGDMANALRGRRPRCRDWPTDEPPLSL